MHFWAPSSQRRLEAFLNSRRLVIYSVFPRFAGQNQRQIWV